QASADWHHTKAAYAFFARERALPAEILLPHQQRTLERMAAHAPLTDHSSGRALRTSSRALDRTAWRVLRALSDREVGITTLWRGWPRLTDIANMYLILHSSEDTANS